MKLESIEIIVNGTESVKQDWSDRGIELPDELHKMIGDAGCKLATDFHHRAEVQRIGKSQTNVSL